MNVLLEELPHYLNFLPITQTRLFPHSPLVPTGEAWGGKIEKKAWGGRLDLLLVLASTLTSIRPLIIEIRRRSSKSGEEKMDPLSSPEWPSRVNISFEKHEVWERTWA